MASDVTESAIFYKLWGWVEAHRKRVQWGAIILVVVAFCAAFLLWRRAERRKAANEALSKAIARIYTAGQPAGPEAFIQVAADFPGSSAAQRALLVGAARYFSEGKYAEAKAQFEACLRDYRDSAFADQARLGVAACLEAQGNVSEAITVYRQVAGEREASSTGAQARLALGRVYEAQGNLQGAREYYLELARPENGPIGADAENRLRQLIVEHPELAVVNSAATNAPAFNPLLPE